MTNHPRRLSHCLILVSLGISCSAGLAQSLEIKWLGEGRYTRTLKVPPGKVSEFCGELKASQKLLWSFESSKVLSYTIYQPDGSQKNSVVAPAEGWKGNGKLNASSGGRYCWAWTNSSEWPVELSFDLKPQP